MENFDDNNQIIERLSILTIQRQEETIQTIKNQISVLKEAMASCESEFGSQNIPEEDKENYLKQVEKIKEEITEMNISIENLKKSIEMLSKSILEKHVTNPNSKTN